MNEDLDPKLQIHFANAKTDLSNDGFAELTLERAGRNRQMQWLRRISIGLASIILLWFALTQMQDLTLLMSQWLMVALIDQSGGTLMQIFAPVNNVAGLLALCLVGLQALLRRV